MAKLDAFGVVVSDMARSLSFYRLLGLDIPDGAEAEGHVEVDLGGGVRLMFDAEHVMQSFSDWTPPQPGGGRRVGLAFRCASPAAVDETWAAAVAAGHAGRTAPWDAAWGQRYAQLEDPDGNPVDLYAALQ